MSDPLDLERIAHDCEHYSYFRYPGAQDDMAALIDEVRRLRALAEAQAMDLMAAKTKIMALMGAMDIKPSQMTDKRRRENR